MVSFQIGTRTQMVFQRRGDQGDSWQRAVVDIGRVSAPFQMVLEARRGNSYAADISIDDVRFENCALPSPSTRCNRSQFKCGEFPTVCR